MERYTQRVICIKRYMNENNRNDIETFTKKNTYTKNH